MVQLFEKEEMKEQWTKVKDSSLSSLRPHFNKVSEKVSTAWQRNRTKSNEQVLDTLGRTCGMSVPADEMEEMVIISILMAKNIPHAAKKIFSKKTTCYITCGDNTRRTRTVSGEMAVFNDKFVYGRRSCDYGSVAFSVCSVNAMGDSSVVDTIALNLDTLFDEDETSMALDKEVVLPTGIVLRVVAQCIPIISTEQRNCLLDLNARTVAINSTSDLAAYGRLFPQIWYGLPEQDVVLVISPQDKVKETIAAQLRQFNTVLAQ